MERSWEDGGEYLAGEVCVVNRLGLAINNGSREEEYYYYFLVGKVE